MTAMASQGAGMLRRAMDYGQMFGKVFMSHCQDEDLVAMARSTRAPSPRAWACSVGRRQARSSKSCATS